MNIAIIGAGNGGQALSGYLSMMGHSVRLYTRDRQKIEDIQAKDGVIQLEGRLSGQGRLEFISDRLEDVMHSAELVMVVTVANAHKELAQNMLPYLEDDQIVVLNPGRTGGAIEFRNYLSSVNCAKNVYIAEAQSLLYACRLKANGEVNVIGVKDEVLLSALPAKDTAHILDRIGEIFPSFKDGENVLRTSLENVGAIFHPVVILFNAATIERGESFYFYRDMTPDIANFIEKFDQERVDVGRAYGLELMPVRDWISHAYKDIAGDTLCDRMKNNPAYYDIIAPTSIYVRQIMEDIPTGIIPILELGKAAGLEMPLFESILNISSALLGIDFRAKGRTLQSLGLSGCDAQEILNRL